MHNVSCDNISVFEHCRNIEKQLTIFVLLEQLPQLSRCSKTALFVEDEGVQCSFILRKNCRSLSPMYWVFSSREHTNLCVFVTRTYKFVNDIAFEKIRYLCLQAEIGFHLHCTECLNKCDLMTLHYCTNFPM